MRYQYVLSAMFNKNVLNKIRITKTFSLTHHARLSLPLQGNDSQMFSLSLWKNNRNWLFHKWVIIYFFHILIWFLKFNHVNWCIYCLKLFYSEGKRMLYIKSLYRNRDVFRIKRWSNRNRRISLFSFLFFDSDYKKNHKNRPFQF